MKTLQRFLVLTMLAGGMILSGAAKADVRKEQVFTLGIHLGNANGTLFGLLNSYVQTKTAHPGAVPLLKRQMKWSIDLAKALKLPTADLEALDKDLAGLEFRAMNTRLQPILASYRVLLGTTYAPQATAVFNLGIELTLAGASVGRALNDVPEKRQPWRDMMVTIADGMFGNITGNKLEATASLATELGKRGRGSDSYESLAAFIDGRILPQWTLDFRKAPGWTGGGGGAGGGGAGGGIVGTVVTKQGGQLTTSDPKDRERKACFSKVHMVNLKSGTTYQIDVESGDGSKGPGFFDVWLRIEDASGRTILSDDDGGTGFNARATFRPTVSGNYRLIVTSYRSGATGSYSLTVRQ